MTAALLPILIVEDDAATAELEGRVLTRAGRTTVAVQRVSEAVSKLRADAYAAVLLDYNLPDGDPWSVVEVAQARVPRVPVIVVTAAGNERIAAEALHHGVSEYLQKTDAFWNQLPELVSRVTDEAQAEERIRRSDALFRLIAQSATDLVASTDLEGVLQEVSAACLPMLGYERDELIGRPVWQFVHEDDRERLVNALRARQHMRLVYRQIKRDGTPLWVEVNASVVRDPATGRAREIVGIIRDIHERKRAEDKFRALLEGGPEANVIVDRNGDIALVNARTEALFGYAREALIGRPFEVLIAERFRKPGSFQLAALARPLETAARRKDGSEFPCEIRVNPLETEAELLVSTTILDISDRKTLQDQHMLLQLGEKLPRFDDVTALVTYVSEALAHYFDVPLCFFTEIDLERRLSIIHGEYRRSGPSHLGEHPMSAFTPALRHELESARVVSIADLSTDLRTADVYAERFEPNGLRSLAAVPLLRKGHWAANFFVADVNPRHWTAREIQMLQALVERTWLWIEHVRMVRALRDSERKFRHFIESTHEGVWEIDDTTRTRFVNPRMAEMLGYTQAEMVGRPMTDFIDDQGRAMAQLQVERRKAGISESRDSKLMRKDGSPLWVRLETSPLTDEAGKFAGALAMVADITAQHQASRELERRVDARTRELKAALTEKEVLLKEIHHRVKNNLQVISSMLNLQAMHIKDDAAQAVFAESQGRVQSIALVHETLYQSGDLSRVNLAEYIRTLVTTVMQAQSSPDRNIATMIDADGVSLPIGCVIPCGLIINELVTNSLKHAFPNRSAGVIRVGLHMRATRRVELVVADDGVGLAPGLDPRKLTSLGLDLVYTFAEQLGARVELQRQNGTEFRFEFPVPEDL